MLFKFLIILTNILTSTNIPSPSIQVLPYWDNKPTVAIYYEIYPAIFSKRIIDDSLYMTNYMFSIATTHNKNYEYISTKTFSDTLKEKERNKKTEGYIFIPLKHMDKYTIKTIIKDNEGINTFKFENKINADTIHTLLFTSPLPYLTIKQGDTLKINLFCHFRKTDEIYIQFIGSRKNLHNNAFYIDVNYIEKDKDKLKINLPLNIPPDKYKVILTAKTERGEKRIEFPLTILFSFVQSDEYYTDMISALSYIYSKDALKPLIEATPNEREKAWNRFWAKRDPNPSTPENENLETFLERFNYANYNYSSYRPGWKTDMGRIYIKFGPPDDIEDHPFDTDQKAYQIWYYSQYNIQFIFVDVTGFGEYKLANREVEPFLNME